MRTIYIVTHPEASHHTEGTVGGWFDSHLTELGKKHAESVARSLASRLDGNTAVILSSDLLRARQTAEVIGNRLETGVALDADLREKSFGEAEGKPQAWLRERSIPLPDEGERLNHAEGISGAETRRQLAERAYRAMAHLVVSTEANHIVVTHGGPSTLLIAAWIGMPIEAVQLNDVSHLSRG
jgi:probable phosphoglycerate mutase